MQCSFDTKDAADVAAAIVLLQSLNLLPKPGTGGGSNGGGGGAPSDSVTVDLPIIGTPPAGAHWVKSGVPGGSAVFVDAGGNPIKGHWVVVEGKTMYFLD